MPFQLDISKVDPIADIVSTASDKQSAAEKLVMVGHRDALTDGVVDTASTRTDRLFSTKSSESTLSGNASVAWDARLKDTVDAPSAMSNVKAVCSDVALDQLEESDELDGIATATRKGRQAKFAYRRIKGIAGKASRSAYSAHAARGQATATASATSAQAPGAAGAAAGAKSTVLASGGTSAASSGGTVIAGGAAVPILLALSLLFAVLLLVGIIAGSESDQIAGLSENEQVVAGLLKNKGLDEVHIAAIMGNWVCESGCNPRRVQCGFGYCTDLNENGIQDCEEQDDYPPELINNPRAGYGLAQWTYPTRSQGLVDFAASCGKHSGDAGVQVDFFMMEFTSSLAAFNQITDVAQACRWFHDEYERSADDESRLQRRVAEAQRIYAALTGGNADTYIAAAMRIANDDVHGYSMVSRTMNPDVDCSSFVYYSLLGSGFTTDQIGSVPFTTFNMGEILEGAGFQRFDFEGLASLVPGDILVDVDRHTEIYFGQAQCLGAHNDYDRQPGDSSGREVCLGDFWNPGYNFVYRLAA